MNSNELKVGMQITFNGMKRVISLIYDYSPAHITVFTEDKCQMTFKPNENIERIEK